jgi:phosphopantetheinyl transferase
MNAMQELFTNQICLLFIQSDQTEPITKETSAFYLQRLCKHLQIDDDIKYSANGKPYFEDETLHFNISNSGNIWCAAVYIHPVGIDVEMTSNHYLLTTLDPILGIETIADWCAKESIIKCLDIGIDEISNIKPSSILHHYHYQGSILKVMPISDSPDYICMVASQQLDFDYTIFKNQL